MFLLYNFILTISALFWVPWMLVRTWRRKEQPIWEERFGNYKLTPRKDRKRIWVHAVSVGEVLAVLPVLRELRSIVPDCEIVLSVTTSSGHRTAREQAVDLYDHLVYFPIDVARFQLAAMQHVQPAVVAIVETELWMNFLWAAKTFDAATLLINGRISDRSFPRSMKVRPFYRALLSMMDRCLMQSAVDADRIKQLGACDVEVFGNVKFDQAIEGLDADAAAWKAQLGIASDRPVVVIGSTRGEEEEDLVLKALKNVGFDQIYVVHAPRHLERVEALAAKVKALTAGVALRSRGESGPYLILDTYGELGQVYSVADVVIIGGGFADLGGQNLLQPLAHGKPVIHGPHMQNFREVAGAAQSVRATRVAATAEELAGALSELLGDSALRGKMGHAARELVQANVGASRRYAEAIASAAQDKMRHA